MKIIKTIKVPVSIVNLYKKWSEDSVLFQKGELKDRPALSVKVTNFLESNKEDINLFSLCKMCDIFGGVDSINTFDHTTTTEKYVYTEKTTLEDYEYKIIRYKYN